MKVKNVKLEWNVLIADFSTNKIKYYNVLNDELIQILHKEIVKKKTITNYEQLKERIKRWCMYYYWSKREWEIGVGGIGAKYPDEYEKIDAWRQIEMNFDRMCEYIIRELKIDLDK
jgi:coproporphyrinogen III oxidase